MNKISVIIKREYLTRVRKKSFILMTILTPLIMASIVILPTVLMMNQKGDLKKIAVVEDGTDLFKGVLRNTNEIEFVYQDNAGLAELKNTFEQKGYYGILYISHLVTNVPNAIQLISKKQPPMDVLQYIENTIKKEVERQKLLAYEIKDLDSIMKSIETSINIQTITIDSTGEEKKTSTGISMALTYLLGLMMYMLIFMFGAQVMRGVIEEKTNRVVEVIVSSVKPVQLMMGKIVGIALVGLTQFLIWVFLTASIATFVKKTLLPDTGIAQVSQNLPQNMMETNNNVTAAAQTNVNPNLSELAGIFDSAANQPWLLIIVCFIFFFVTGYLLYASIFAAIGSAVDNETETQQFMLPVTIPIILALMVAMGTMQNPESPLAFWFSMIPLTSPIVMMARIPFGVPLWQLLTSMLLMVVTFIAFVWMAAKVYRTGILMYGKKTSWKEMWKWLRYSG